MLDLFFEKFQETIEIISSSKKDYLHVQIVFFFEEIGVSLLKFLKT